MSIAETAFSEIHWWADVINISATLFIRMGLARAVAYGLWDILHGFVVLALVALPMVIPVVVYVLWWRS